MNERHWPSSHDDLDARLTDLAPAVAFPPTPDLAAAVSTRLRTNRHRDGIRPRVRPLQRALRRSLLLAAAIALLVVGAAVAVGLGLQLLSIDRATLPTEPQVSSVPFDPHGSTLGLGRATLLEDARTQAPFPVVPQGLGVPDAVYVGNGSLRGQVAFVYAPRDGLPTSELLGGAALLITQNRGTADAGLAHKIVDTTDATVEPVDVDGAAGVWISGEPHLFWYLAPDGSFISDSRRVVGDTLAWERDGVLYRIEGSISLSKALEIARSLR